MMETTDPLASAFEAIVNALDGTRWEYVEVAVSGNIILHGFDNRKRKPPRELDLSPCDAADVLRGNRKKPRMRP